MTKPALKKGLEILSGSQNINVLRRLIVMTIVGRNLRPVSGNEESTTDDSLSALLSRLPTKTLAEVASISKGKTGIKDALPGTFPLVVTAETRSSADHFDFEGPAVMIPMVSSTGHGDASLKRIHFQDGQYAVGSILAVVHPKDSSVLSARYLHAYLSAFKDELLVSRMVGTANVSLTAAKIGDVPVPLLPIQGQHAIAELMTLCDRLDVGQADAASAHARLVETLLCTLTQCSDAADLTANWLRLAENFETLFSTESCINMLKQAIIDLAVSGVLTRKSSEGVNEALCSPSVESEEKPYRIKGSWKWYRMDEVVAFQGGSQPPKNTFIYEPRDGYTRLVQIRDFKSDAHLTYIPNERANRLFGKDDVMIGRYGPPVFQILRGLSGTYNVALMKANPINSELSKDFLFWLLQESRIHDTVVAESERTAGQTGLRLPLLHSFIVGIPPKDEQQRIVTKIDELMTLCERLQADLATARQQQAVLANALIETALEAA